MCLNKLTINKITLLFKYPYTPKHSYTLKVPTSSVGVYTPVVP